METPHPPRLRRYHTLAGLLAVVAVLAIFPGACLLAALLPQTGPHWLGTLPVLALGLLMLATVVDMRRRATRQRAGLCPSCGYDLRATPARCPECGAVPPPPAYS